MAYTTVQICNSALTKIGERAINSLDDDLVQARACKLRYANVFDTVLSLYPFTCTLKRQNLTYDAGYTKQWEYDYQYSLPADCLHIWEVVDSDGDRLYEFSKEGDKILSNLSSIGILYTRRITDTGVIDHDVAELLSYYLAADLSERLNPDVNRTNLLKQEFERFFARVRTADARRQAPRYYGTTDPFNKDTDDHPMNWLDARL